MKVRIKSLGLKKAAYGQQVDYGLSLGRTQNTSETGLNPKKSITGIPREMATLEAEGGETVVGQISGDGIVDHMKIEGPRHSNGGVPLDLPEDSFIFSDTASMKINDEKILQMFGKKPRKGGYTPAELAKPYDIQKYKAILMDPDTDRLSRKTAEIMINNIVMKLGALALAQEAKKGFPQGIPEIAKPYMEANGISEEDLIPELKAQAEQMQAQQQAMQMQQAPQGMPPMMPSGQPVAMPQQGMAPPQQPMMDPRQMMAMQQEQQMMPPQPQQGMPMADIGIQQDKDLPIVDGVRPYTLHEYDLHNSIKDYKDGLFKQDNRIFKDVFQSKEPIEDKVIEESKVSLPSSPVDLSYDQKMKILTDLQQGAAHEAAHAIDDYRSGVQIIQPRVMQSRLIKQMHGGTPMAAYGMQLGGYDMPFTMTDDGLPKAEGGIETVEGRTAEKVIDFTPGGRESVTEQSGYEARTYETPGAEEGSANYYSGGRGTEESVAKGICKKIKESNNLQELFYIEGGDPPFPAYLKPSGITPADPGFDDAIAAAIEKLKANPLYTDCIQGVQDATAPTIRDEYKVKENTKEKICACIDPETKEPIPGTEMTYEEILASGKIEGYTVEQGCPENFGEVFCSKENESIELIEQEEEAAATPFSYPTAPFLDTGVADPEKASLDIVGSGEVDFYDYKSKVNLINSKAEQEKAKTVGMPIGQRMAANAFIDAEANKQKLAAMDATMDANVKASTALGIREDETALKLAGLQANIDQNYLAQQAAAENQRIKNKNDARVFRYNAARDEARIRAGLTALENRSDQFDAFGNFVKGLPLDQRRALENCIATTGDIAGCIQKFGKGDMNPTPTPTPTPENTVPEADPNAGATTARYGGVTSPYVMATSVYPFLI